MNSSQKPNVNINFLKTLCDEPILYPLVDPVVWSETYKDLFIPRRVCNVCDRKYEVNTPIATKSRRGFLSCMCPYCNVKQLEVVYVLVKEEEKEKPKKKSKKKFAVSETDDGGGVA